MNEYEIIKCHGASNDFIIFDEFETPDLNDTDRFDLAVILCDRANTINGSDGILYFQPSTVADARMRMFNPDGTEAEMCGNGIRCIGRYAAEKLGKNTLNIATMKAILQLERVADIYPGIVSFRTSIAPLSLRPDSLPMLTSLSEFHNQVIAELSDKLLFSAISVPNPHLVCFLEDREDLGQLEEMGRKANQSKYFPKGVNVSFCYVINEHAIFSATYERGVGLTNACGTAMSASAYIACKNKLMDFGTPINVVNKGGMVICVAHQHKRQPHNITLSGNATYIHRGKVKVDGNKKRLISYQLVKQMESEALVYAQFQAMVAKKTSESLNVNNDRVAEK